MDTFLHPEHKLEDLLLSVSLDSTSQVPLQMTQSLAYDFYYFYYDCYYYYNYYCYYYYCYCYCYCYYCYCRGMDIHL